MLKSYNKKALQLSRTFFSFTGTLLGHLTIGNVDISMILNMMSMVSSGNYESPRNYNADLAAFSIIRNNR